MGGGASSMSSPLEQLLITTMMIGRAIAAISCPGMYTIYDFHSPKAPRLKLNGHLANNPFAILQQGYNDDDDDGEVESNKRKNPEVYNKMFTVQVGEDKIYIENVLHSNESGWLPLHACCMSLVTLDAGLRIVDEMLLQERQLQHQRDNENTSSSRSTGDGEEKKDSASSHDNTTGTTTTTTVTVNYLDLSTINGPGAFNSQWTPLHMACAYGVEPLVTRLLEEGVNVNTQNSYGYTPLLEACRRGYIDIVQRLLGDSYLDVNHLPSSDLACESPFSTAPPQRPLAESTRAGFITVVQLLLEDERVQINASNSIGWTALHEACFYNRKEIVQLLLLKAADPTARTAMSNAMPYHLTSDSTIRDMLKTLGGSLAIPTDTDKIDMLTVLEELASFKNMKNNYNSSGYSTNNNNANSYSSSKKYNNRQMVVYNSGNNTNDDDEGDDRDTTVTITNMLLNQSLSNNSNNSNTNNTTVQYIISIGGDDDDYNDGNNSNDGENTVDMSFKKVEFSQAYLANKRATTNSNNNVNGNTTVVDDYSQYMNDTPPSSSSGRAYNSNNNHNSSNSATNNHREYTAAEVPHTRKVTNTNISNNNKTTTANTTTNNNSNSSSSNTDESKSTSLLGALPVLSNISPKNNNKTNTAETSLSQSVSLTADAKPFIKRMYHNNSNTTNSNNTNDDSANTHLITRIDTSHMANSSNSSSQSQVPKSFVCELSHKIMTDPVQSIYGNIFERSVIAQWIEIHGKICPLTGAPLCITDLTTCLQLAQDIRQYLLQRATTGADVAINSNDNDSSNRKKQHDGKVDDLYSF